MDSIPELTKRIPSEKKLPLIQVLAEILKSPKLAPVMPYKPDAPFGERIKDAFAPPSNRGPELARIASMWDLPDKPTPADINRAVEEAVLINTLLFAATSKPGRKPRLDFLLMHGLTSALFIPSLCSNLVKNPESQARLLRHWASVIWLLLMVTGRPQVNGDLLMGYNDRPLAPHFENVCPTPSKDAIITPATREAINPWAVILQASLRAPDAHVPKCIRTLLFGAIHYGTRGPGEFPGALDENGKEVLPGLKTVDGTIFIRATGVLMETLGWVDWGQPEGAWDRSGLGWDEAWDHENAPLRDDLLNSLSRV